MQLPYDPNDPKFEPPEGANALVWRLSRELWLAHQPHPVDNHCLACRHWYPCVNRQLAEWGLLRAVVPDTIARLRPEVVPYRLGCSGNEYNR